MTYALIDLSNLFHRGRHATQGDAFTKAGMALHIAFRSLRKLHREHAIDHMVFCVDNGSWRYAAYPAYKAKRRLDRQLATPAEKEEFEIFLATMNDTVSFLERRTMATVLNTPGMEADDFVARWVQMHPDDQHIILSGDSDFIQLLATNVRIYDAMNERMIAHDRVSNAAGQTLAFTVAPATGKLKVGEPDADFVAPADWTRLALFVKLVRGDSSDGIFASNPGVRFNGSAKRVGIREAWEDRVERGFAWNNFMLQEWDKLLGFGNAGEPPKAERVRVLDEYQRNESLIDLTRQPAAVIDILDASIVAAVQKPVISNVAIHFMRFCHEHGLEKLKQEAADHGAYLNRGYLP